MTAERFAAAARARDATAICELLAPMSEADRAQFASVAREVVEAERERDVGAAFEPMLLLAFGVLPAAEIRKLGWRRGHIPDALHEVLRRRSPERLAPIVEQLLDDVGGPRVWRTVRPLVRAGVVPRPDRPSYTIAMLAATAYGNAADLVANDPGLLDVEVWRLFEVEGGGEDSLANHEKFARDTWGTFFRELAGRDPAARQRLLDLSLAALARDFAAYRAGWFSRFHETLAPTVDERAERVHGYLGLLRSRVGPTVSFAVSALTRIDRAGRLPPDLLLDRVGPVLGEGAKGTANAGLEMVRRAGARSPEVARRAAVVGAEGLANPSPEIQRAAIELIDSLGQEGDDLLAKAIGRHVPGLASSLRATAMERLARFDAERALDVSPAPIAPADPAPRRAVSPIGPDRAIEPVTTVEALVDLAVSILETGEPADDVERMLDGVGRLSVARADPFSRLAPALAKRARTILARRESSPFSGFDARADVAGVILAWASGELVPADPVHTSDDPGAAAFLSARAREVAEAAATRRPFISIAAPTHAGGWIDPAVLVRRLRDRPPESRLDLVAAILRLAPLGRDEALVSAADLAGEVGAVVRYALGGDEPIGRTAPWWVAAARTRAPGSDDPAVERRHARLGPDAGQAAQIRLTTTDQRRFIGGLRLETEPRGRGEPDVELPTVLMLRETTGFWWTGRSDPAMVRWMAAIQPGDREPWAAVGSLRIARNLDWWSAEWANRVFLEPFIDPVTTIGPYGRLLVGLALGSKEAGERGLAADIVALALGDGRLTGPTLAEGLTAAAALGCDRPQRWALSLADVAASSGAVALDAVEAIARTLPALTERPPAKLVPLLRLLDELTATHGGGPAEPGRASLERLTASGGQTGRLARSILSRT